MTEPKSFEKRTDRDRHNPAGRAAYHHGRDPLDDRTRWGQSSGIDPTALSVRALE